MTYILPFVEVHAVDHCNHTCASCHNYSPHAPVREYAPEAYYEGLDILARNDVQLKLISVMGGEPFLHGDLIGFCRALFERYKRPLTITTNAFWFNRENIRLFRDLWQYVYVLKISAYPSIRMWNMRLSSTNAAPWSGKAPRAGSMRAFSSFWKRNLRRPGR